jgi:hypothetical protein
MKNRGRNRPEPHGRSGCRLQVQRWGVWPSDGGEIAHGRPARRSRLRAHRPRLREARGRAAGCRGRSVVGAVTAASFAGSLVAGIRHRSQTPASLVCWCAAGWRQPVHSTFVWPLTRLDRWFTWGTSASLRAHGASALALRAARAACAASSRRSVGKLCQIRHLRRNDGARNYKRQWPPAACPASYDAWWIA